MRRKSFRGQNVVEYLLLTVAVVVVALSVFRTGGGPMKRAMENMLNGTVNGIKVLNSELRYSNAAN